MHNLCAPRTSDTDSLSSVTFSTTTIEDTGLPFTGRWSFLNDSSLSPLDGTYHTTSYAGDFVSLNFSGAFTPTSRFF